MAESQKASNFEEIFLQFSTGLKDLKCLRDQLYSAAEHFESSFDGENHKQDLVETSKDYVAKALVNTVDHLGSAADKLNRFLDQKADEFSDTSLRFSCIQQRINTFQGFLDFTVISKQSGMAIAPKHHKKYTLPGMAESLRLGKSVSLYSNCISSPQHGMLHSKQNTSISNAFQATSGKQQNPLSSRKGNSRVASSEIYPQLNFSFTRIVPIKETGKRSASPLRFQRRFGAVANRSISPSPHESRKWIPSESRRAISVSRRPETMSRDADIESYTKKSKHMFKAFLKMHRPKNEP